MINFCLDTRIFQICFAYFCHKIAIGFKDRRCIIYLTVFTLINRSGDQVNFIPFCSLSNFGHVFIIHLDEEAFKFLLGTQNLWRVRHPCFRKANHLCPAPCSHVNVINCFIKVFLHTVCAFNLNGSECYFSHFYTSKILIECLLIHLQIDLIQ